MIVAHSSAVYPSARIILDPDTPRVNSLTLLNPAGHRRIKAMKPAWFVDGCVKMNITPLGRKIFTLFGKAALKAKGVAVQVNDSDNVIISAMTMALAGIEKVSKCIYSYTFV